MGKTKQGRLINKASFIEGCLFLLAAVLLIWHALHQHASLKGVDWALSPYLFPLLVSLCLLILSVFFILEGFQPSEARMKPPLRWPLVLITLICALAYFFLMQVAGFVLATACFLLAMLLFLGERRALVLLLLPMLFSSALYFLFARLLHVLLPTSPMDFLRQALDLLFF
ncbi:MAG: tripartite tricarboxylate transporter TctB family protein [Clostridiales bacterium]|nr:tripartite tricarboxylate transporter TctB family protein [Clostridiales bacterium]